MNARDIHLSSEYLPFTLTLGEGIGDGVEILIFGLRLNRYVYGIFICVRTLGFTAVFNVKLIKNLAVYARKVKIGVRRLRASVIDGRCGNYPAELSEIY